MTLALYEVQATIPLWSGLPTDVVTNVWHFMWDGAGDPVDTNLTDLAGTVAGFYEYVFEVGAVPNMAAYSRPNLFRVKAYRMQDPKPRAPVYDEIVPLTVDKETNTALPPEVAICCSFYANAGSGEHPARRRGRIFLGALGDSVGGYGTATTPPIINSQTMTRINEAAENVADNAPVTDWRWVIFSPTDYALSGNYNAASHTVIGGWVDNAYDNQRRRGVASTSRLTWT